MFSATFLGVVDSKFKQKPNLILILTDYPLHLHLADAFIQSDLHMCDLQCIHILHLH